MLCRHLFRPTALPTRSYIQLVVRAEHVVVKVRFSFRWFRLLKVNHGVILWSNYFAPTVVATNKLSEFIWITITRRAVFWFVIVFHGSCLTITISSTSRFNINRVMWSIAHKFPRTTLCIAPKYFQVIRYSTIKMPSNVCLPLRAMQR